MLEDYRIFHELTRTQHGQLMLAQHLKSGQKVVIKSLILNSDQDQSDAEEQIKRFHRESDIHMYLRHESIVPALETFVEDQKAYLVTAYQPYPTLKELLKRKKSFSPLEALNIIQQLCQALHYIHDQGVIHRDVHPENILVTDENKILLLDFGCARKVFAPNITQEKSLPGSFFIQGTLYYMSPEQLLGQTELDFRTDVFSAGVILYQLLTQQLPFEGDELKDVVQNLLANEPHPIVASNPYVPEALEQMVFQSLKRDPDYRTPTARKLALEIEELLDDPELYYCEARWHLERNRSPDNAQDYTLFALQKDAYHLPSLHLLGDIFSQRKQWERARRCYERILEKSPQSAEAYFCLARVEEATGNIAAAVQSYEKAWQETPDNRDYRYALAAGLYLQGRQYQAMEHLAALMEAYSDWFAPFALSARIYYQQDQQATALQHYLKARELESADQPLLFDLAALQHELGHYLEAQETYLELYRLDPQNDQVIHNLANISYLLDELGESRRLLEKMLESHQRPRAAKWEISWRLLAFVYARLNLHDEAIEAYKYAILCCPDRLENYLFLASAYREQLQLEYAIHTLIYVSELNVGKNEALVFFLLARAYYEQGKETDSQRALERCLICFKTLTQTMEQQAKEDLKLLKERERDRLRHARVMRFDKGRKPFYSKQESMNILSFPTSQHRVV